MYIYIYIYISHADNNNKIRFIIYNKKSKTVRLVVNNNSFPPAGLGLENQCYSSI